MENSSKTLLIWFLISVSLLITIHFQPWGSRNQKVDEFAMYQNINYIGKIENCQLGSEGIQNEQRNVLALSDLSSFKGSSSFFSKKAIAKIPHSESYLKLNYNPSVKQNENTVRTIPRSQLNFQTSETFSSTSKSNHNTGYSAVNITSYGIMSSTKYFSNHFKRPSNWSSNDGGTNSLTVDLSLTNNVLFGADEDPLQKGASDPGEEPIPVGDGFWLLIMLIIAYAGWKFKFQKA